MYREVQVYYVVIIVSEKKGERVTDVVSYTLSVLFQLQRPLGKPVMVPGTLEERSSGPLQNVRYFHRKVG